MLEKVEKLLRETFPTSYKLQRCEVTLFCKSC